MESEHHYELRSRSRSRSHTPMIFNLTDSEHSEHHYDLRRKDSRERSQTPAEVSSSRRSNSRSLPGSVQKLKEMSMEPITEKKVEINEETTDNQSNHDSSLPPTTKKVERRSERVRVKRQIFTNGQNDTKTNTPTVDRIEQKRKSLTPKRTVTSDYSSEEGDKDEDRPSRPGSAYEIYKQAGDWWNVFPKTDYTYSQASQCRYEIAPGVLAMPNMSRPSIHSDGSSSASSLSLSQQTLSQTSQQSTREGNTNYLDCEINDTIEQNRRNEENARLLSRSMTDNSGSRLIYRQTHVEKYTQQRAYFFGDSSIIRNRFGGYTQVDSDVDLDDAVSLKSRSHDQQWRITKWSVKFINAVTMIFVGLFQFINTKILRRNLVSSHTPASYRYRESKWSKIWKKIDDVLQYFYLLLIRILYLDSWMLSRTYRVRENFSARRSRVFWLILLPPLLLAGLWLFPYAYSSTVSRVSSILSKDVTSNTVFANERSNGPMVDRSVEINNRINDAINEEIKQSIALLINRVEKLENTGINQEKRLENITKSIESTGNPWDELQRKLSTLEEKVQSQNTDESTQHTEIKNIQVEFSNLRQLYAQLKTCCDKNAITLNNNFNEHVEQVISNYFGIGMSKNEMNKIIENLVTASNNVMMKNNENCENNREVQQTELSSSLSEQQVQKIVKEILKIYDADKTGRVDYALESAGGQIISIRCTQRYNVNTRAFKVLGFTLFYESGDPRTVIQGHTIQPGVCWAFQDFPGYLLIKLRNSIKITGFTMEHAPRTILPNNEMKSAPRKFNVWGFKEENDLQPVLLGEYEFLDNNESLQYFPVENTETHGYYEFVELRIHSNHGQLEYTCLYRFRVHGVPG